MITLTVSLNMFQMLVDVVIADLYMVWSLSLSLSFAFGKRLSVGPLFRHELCAVASKNHEPSDSSAN